MPRNGDTWDLLISCPEDVEKFIGVIEETIKRFNKIYGRSYNIAVNAMHWREDSYPELGDRPQNIINRQLVSKCEMMIAVFWTKFGTPTDRYASGTEEEIEEMISSGKPVFLYFLDKECRPSDFSPDYEKVERFKERCRQRGIYKEVSDEKDLSEKFYDHLMQYFSEELNKTTNAAALKNGFKETQHKFQAGRNNVESAYATVSKNNYAEQKRVDIIRRIRSIQKNVLPGRRNGYNEQPGTVSDAVIFQPQKDLITRFAAENGIWIDSTFWHLGNLRRRVIGGGRVVCDGRDEEEERYKEIGDLCKEIEEYNQLKTSY